MCRIGPYRIDKTLELVLQRDPERSVGKEIRAGKK